MNENMSDSSIKKEAASWLKSFRAKKQRNMHEELDKLPKELAREVAVLSYIDKRRDVEAFFENGSTEDTRTHESPCGRYVLHVRSISTKKGAWSYTLGRVIEKSSGITLFTIKRNYSSFPFHWITEHVNGHKYLVCGEDYQAMTILELDTGRRREEIEYVDVMKGFGFCFTDCPFFDVKSSILAVAGCHWACPYEYRFYDFSDPMNGVKTLETDDMIDCDERPPVINADGTITCFQTKDLNDYSDDCDDDSQPNLELRASTTYERVGDKLKKINGWISDDEKRERQERKEANERYDKWWNEFKEHDPLYVLSRSTIKQPPFKPQDHDSVGVTHEAWCPDFCRNAAGQYERRICRRIHWDQDKKLTIDLEFAHETGPIKLMVYKEGEPGENRFFMEHSVESMESALKYAKDLIMSS